MNLKDDSDGRLAVDELIERASSRLKSKDLDGALADARRAVDLDPENGRAQAVLGFCLTRADLLPEAADALKAAARLEERDPIVRFNAALAVRQTEGATAALRLLEDATQRGVSDPRLLCLKGWLHIELDQAEEALECFDRALAGDDGDELTLQGRAWALQRLGETTEAHELLSDCPRARQGDAEGLILQGWLLADQGKYRDALRRFKRALDKDKDSARAWHGKVSCLRLLAKFERADAALQSALRRLPQEVALLNEQGWLRLDQGRPNDALDVFSSVLQVDDDNEYALMGMARSLRLLERHPEARAALERVPDYARDSLRYQSERALVALARYDGGGVARSVLREAVSAFEAWLDLDPTDPIARAGLGMAKWRQRRHREAVECLKQALACAADHPRESEIRVLLGDLHRELGEPQEARAEYRRALADDPSACDAFYRLGELLEEQGELASALDHFARAGARGDAYALRWLGSFYEREGSYDVAREHWRDLRQTLEARRGELDAEDHYVLGCVILHVDADLQEAERVLRNGLAVAERTGADNAELWAALTCLHLSGSDAQLPHQRLTHGKKADEAYCQARDAFAARGRDLQNLVRLVQLHLAKEMHDEARACLNEALKLDSENGEVHAALGVLQGRTGRHDKAVESLKEAVRRDERDLTLRSRLASALFLADRIEAAEREHRRVLAAAPEHIDSLIGLGEMYLKLGNERDDPDFFEQAVDRFGAASDLAKNGHGSRRVANSERADLLYACGYARVRLYESSSLGAHEEQLHKAEKDFQRSAALDPGQHMAARARDKIRKRLRRGSPDRFTERVAPFIIAFLALMVFGLTQASLIADAPMSELPSGMYATLTFGALLFVVSGFTLPRLLKLRVAGMELQNSAVERAPDPSPLRIHVQQLRAVGPHTAMTLLAHRGALKRVEPRLGSTYLERTGEPAGPYASWSLPSDP